MGGGINCAKVVALFVVRLDSDKNVFFVKTTKKIFEEACF
jgi:hypothetical protein